MNPYVIGGLGLIALFGFQKNNKVAKMLNDTSRQRVKKVLSDKYGLDFKNWVIVGIRGALPNEKGNLVLNENQTNEWNDTIVIIKGTESKSYQATVDPGLTWLKNPMKGLEKLGTGRQEPGLMSVSIALIKGAPAFLINELKIRRDSNHDYRFDSSDTVYEGSKSNGYFIHARYASGNVNQNSAGCAVLNHSWNSAEWKEFYKTLSESGQTKIPYVLIEGKNL